MDRRTFMITGAWWSTVAGGAWPWLARAATGGNTLAIVDSTLACGPSFARYATDLKLLTFETGDDIGALWYTTLAPLLNPLLSPPLNPPLSRTRNPPHGPTFVQSPPALIGVTRASDYFVLGELVTRAGHRLVEARHEPSAGTIAQQAHVAFAFAPRFLRDDGGGT